MAEEMWGAAKRAVSPDRMGCGLGGCGRRSGGHRGEEGRGPAQEGREQWRARQGTTGARDSTTDVSLRAGGTPLIASGETRLS